jgi:CRP/FNR family cyclic AMP-dependent transcriptional regulator
MKADGIWGNIFRLERKKDALAEILKNVPLFKDLTTKELLILEKLIHNRTFEAGEPVFVESEPGSGMYVIRTGRVDVVLKHKSEQPLVLAELETGDFFGEMALLGDSARSASAICRERSELIGFFHPDLEEIINLHPAMGAKITFGLAKTLSDRLRYTNAQLRDVWEIRGTNDKNTG